MTLPALGVKFHYRPLGNLPYGWIVNVYDLLATEADKSSVGTINRPLQAFYPLLRCPGYFVNVHNRPLHRSFAHYPSFCKKLATVRIPLKNCEREYFSFGACRLSSGKPNPINTTGTRRTSSKRAATGIEPPSRIKTGS